MMKPSEGTILFRLGAELRGSYMASRDTVRVSTDGGFVEVPFIEGEWQLTRDRKLSPMQVAELCWSVLAAYRRMMGRQQPEWSMLSDNQRIAFCQSGDASTTVEQALELWLWAKPEWR